MLVSRKNLPLIHLFPAEAPPRLYMLQALSIKASELLRAAALCRELLQPLAEHSVERLMLGLGQQARLLDQLSSSGLNVMFFIRNQGTRYSCT